MKLRFGLKDILGVTGGVVIGCNLGCWTERPMRVYIMQDFLIANSSVSLSLLEISNRSLTNSSKCPSNRS